MALLLWEEKFLRGLPLLTLSEMLSVLPGFDFERNYSSSTCSVLG